MNLFIVGAVVIAIIVILYYAFYSSPNSSTSAAVEGFKESLKEAYNATSTIFTNGYDYVSNWILTSIGAS